MSNPRTIDGTLLQLRRPIPPLSALLPALLEAELLGSAQRAVATPVFFTLRGRKLTRFELSTVSADSRDALARDLGSGADGVAMFAGVAGHAATWAIKIESATLTTTVVLVLRDGAVLARTV
ncbi:MAG: hypothetical protein EXR69_10560 [Myxococcales bacterium]|nr:hypothetical protein [Myxococcales bacterium]